MNTRSADIRTNTLLLRATLFFVTSFVAVSFASSQVAVKPAVGIIYEAEKDSVLYAGGCRLIEESVGRSFSPRTINEEMFEQKLKLFRNAKVKVYSCNIFMHGYLKLVGPSLNEHVVLGYVDTVMQRCSIAGIKLVVLGSGESRRVPAGFDHQKAKAQFIDISRKMAMVSAKYGVTIAIENLNSGETNFINTLAEALDVVKQVDHPNFKLTADIYHMLRENEPASAIEEAGAYLIHCHIAEKEKRTAPGIKGDDFRPYLGALKKINFSGVLMLECGWDNINTQVAPALQYLQRQLDEVYR
ncbi:MAG: sugar phosphate isomerase/epimerase family protein [Chitinophagaceae bacterium]|nr:sugar phosphate isomerase/epimerase family protein [Chitinophagaceae bacterium]